MTRYYVSHYFDFKNIGIFMLVSLIGLVAVLAVVLITAKLQMRRRLNYDRLNERDVAELTRSHRIRKIGMIESFFEMTFSSTSVLLFLSLYYIIDARIHSEVDTNDIAKVQERFTSDCAYEFAEAMREAVNVSHLVMKEQRESK